MVDFNYYKSKISIIQIAEDLGYRQDLSKGKITPVLRLGDDVVIVKNPCSSNEYFFGNSGEKGDLISFVKQNIASFPQFANSNIYVRINMVLRHYANIPYVEGEKYKTEKAVFNLADYEVVEGAVGDYSFLSKERGLSLDTISVFLPFLRKVKNVKRHDWFYNISFPFAVAGTDKITNFELRNYNFKGMAKGGEKSSSVWSACFTQNPLSIEDVYFFESGIDAMSFYELNEDNIDFGKSAFVSIGGNLMPEQIKNVAEFFVNAKFHTAFDADTAGAVYDVKVNCILDKKTVAVAVNECVSISFENEVFVFKKENFSLDEFLKKTKGKKNIIVHKPNHGKDFNDELKAKKI